MACHIPAIRLAILFAVLTVFSACAAAQSAALPANYLVFPFEKLDASPRLEWLGEGLAELTVARLASAGQQPFSRAERLAELERYGLPPSSQLSRASMLHIAQDLDADYVVFGSFSSDGTSLRVESRLLTVNPAALLPVVRETGLLDSIQDLDTRLVWRLLSRQVPALPLSLAALNTRQRPLRLDAFEHYIRGLTSVDDDSRIRELREAWRLDATWSDPVFTLGQTYLQRNDCGNALAFFGRIPRSDVHYRDAQFSQGVCHLLRNEPDQAEAAFVALQGFLHGGENSADPPELLNDLAIAQSRQGKVATASDDLHRAADLDPDEDDYAFNLGLLALRSNRPVEAAERFRQAADSEPDNAEDRALLIYALGKAGKKEEAAQERSEAQENFGPKGIPAVEPDAADEEPLAKLDRIKMEIDPAEFRFASRTADAAETAAPAGSGATGLATILPTTPAGRVRHGRQELSGGNLAAAEQEFRAALASDPKNAGAHGGLAEIRRKQGKLDEAVLEWQVALQSRDSAAIRISLARVYLEQKRKDLARAEVDHALQLAPNYAPAKQLLEYLQKTDGGSPPAMAPNPKPAQKPLAPNRGSHGGVR